MIFWNASTKILDGGVKSLSKYELYMQVDAVQRFLADLYDHDQQEKKKAEQAQPPKNDKKKGTVKYG